MVSNLFFNLDHSINSQFLSFGTCITNICIDILVLSAIKNTFINIILSWYNCGLWHKNIVTLISDVTTGLVFYYIYIPERKTNRDLCNTRMGPRVSTARMSRNSTIAVSLYCLNLFLFYDYLLTLTYLKFSCVN